MKFARVMPVAAVAITLAASACRLPIEASNVDQQCAVDEDCIAVIVGDTCSDSCESAGINVSEQQRYDDARGAPCPPNLGYVAAASFGCTVPEPLLCDQAEAFCEAGTCASRPVPFE